MNERHIINRIRQIVESFLNENRAIEDLTFSTLLEYFHLEESNISDEVLRNLISDIILIETQTNADSSVVAKKILNVLKNMPTEYEFVFRLPQNNKLHKVVSICDKIALHKVDRRNAKVYTAPFSTYEHYLKKMIFGYSLISVGDCVLTVKCNGYVDKMGYSHLIDIINPEFVRDVIVGIYIALGVLKPRNTLPAILSSNNIYSIYDNNGELVRYNNETDEYDAILNKYEFADVDNNIFELGNNVVTNLFCATQHEDNKSNRMIKNGVFWFVRSIGNKDNHLKAVFTVAAFEYLTGLPRNTKKEEFRDVVSKAIGDEVCGINVSDTLKSLYLFRNDIVHGDEDIIASNYYNVSGSIDKSVLVYNSIRLLERFIASQIFDSYR